MSSSFPSSVAHNIVLPSNHQSSSAANRDVYNNTSYHCYEMLGSVRKQLQLLLSSNYKEDHVGSTLRQHQHQQQLPSPAVSNEVRNAQRRLSSLLHDEDKSIECLRLFMLDILNIGTITTAKTTATTAIATTTSSSSSLVTNIFQVKFQSRYPLLTISSSNSGRWLWWWLLLLMIAVFDIVLVLCTILIGQKNSCR